MIKVIVFDGEGTLFSSLPKNKKIQNILKEKGYRRRLAEIDRAFLKAKRIANLLKSKGLTKLDSAGYLLENEIRLILLDFDDHEVAMLARIVNSQWTDAGNRTPYPETRIVLESLKRRKYKLGLLTAGAAISYRKTLRKLGLETYFSFVLGEDTVNAPKPDLRAYKRVIDEASCKPNEILFVGDNPTNDYSGPIASGMKAVLVDRANEHRDVPSRILNLAPLAMPKFFKNL